MDVDRDNFYDLLPEILENIQQADFIAIDGEFSGIIPINKLNYFDTPEERYQRHYNYDRHYMMIQMGVATVRCLDQEKNQFSVQAYNFYLFPEGENDAFDFRSKTSSLQFLASNRFDFTRLFLKGIPFVCKTTHLKKVRSLDDEQQKLKNSATSNNENPTDEELLRKTMTGFSEVVWKIQESGKPVIGHNLHMDIFHIIQQFFTPMPQSYDEYRTLLQTLFPKVADTKLIASIPIFRDLIPNTALQAIYRSVTETAFESCHFRVAEDFQYAQGEHEHTAGYDAMCTAVIFVKMLNYINKTRKPDSSTFEYPSIEAFYGKYFLMRSFDLRYIDYLGENYVPDRSSVFYVSSPSSNVTDADIRTFCRKWNGITYDRLDATTFAIGFSMKNETVDSMLLKLRTNEKSFSIHSYAEFHSLNESPTKSSAPVPLFNIDSPTTFSKKRKREHEPMANEINKGEIRTYEDLPAPSPVSNPTITKLIEEREKSSLNRKPKLFDFNDEW